MGNTRYFLSNSREIPVFPAGMGNTHKSRDFAIPDHCLDRTPDCTFWTGIVPSKIADRKNRREVGVHFLYFINAIQSYLLLSTKTVNVI